MSILYACVARGIEVQSEFSATTGNFSSFFARLLPSLGRIQFPKSSYSYEQHKVHCLTSGDFSFFVLTEYSFKHTLSFLFLAEVEKKWLLRPGPEFRATLGGLVYTFNTDPRLDRLAHMQGEAEEVKALMINNLVHCTEKIMDRGEKIESLKDQTSTMVEASYDFHLASRETRSRLRGLNKCLIVGIVIFLLGLGYGISVVLCGFKYQNC